MNKQEVLLLVDSIMRLHVSSKEARKMVEEAFVSNNNKINALLVEYLREYSCSSIVDSEKCSCFHCKVEDFMKRK
jgi:hypothetical protein